MKVFGNKELIESLKGVPYDQLDLVKMLESINEIVGSDWAEKMSWKQLPDSKPYTQKEASKMATALGKIYTIAHCLTCKACQPKWIKGQEASSNSDGPDLADPNTHHI